MLSGEIYRLDSGFRGTFEMMHLLLYISDGIYKEMTLKEYQQKIEEELEEKQKELENLSNQL